MTQARPILFSGPMVRALLAGNKTQTRRAVNPRKWGRDLVHLYADAVEMNPEQTYYTADKDEPGNWGWENIIETDPVTLTDMIHYGYVPYGKPGDLLWVRETFGYVSPDEHVRPHRECRVEYRADLPDDVTDQPGEWPVDAARHDPDAPKWRPSIHMPRSASRITLEITNVRVERLHNINDADALAEGVDVVFYGESFTPRSTFMVLWSKINGIESWDANPFVWVIEFLVHPRNVDDVLRDREAA